MKRMWMTWLMLVPGFLLLSACGFHLRGMAAGSLALPPVLLAGEDSQLNSDVASALKRSRVEVVQDKTMAGLVIWLGPVTQERRVLSVSSAGKVQEYELHYALTFSVVDTQGREQMPSQVINVRRDYLFSETEVLAKAEQEQSLYTDMYREALSELIVRLRTWSAQQRGAGGRP
ncbi:MAG: hypothetical protein HY940_06215 [Gammaproteobacteria bacterium]|nr:hypothetical protein [Gammaproteobacteria bacterium]